MRNLLYWIVRLSVKPFLRPWVPLAIQRRWSNALGLATRRPSHVESSTQDMGGIPAVRMRPRSANGKVILYLHGGAYILGGAASHGSLAALIGAVASAEAYLPIYRLAPEHPFPAALDDAVAAYRWLLAQGHASRDIVIAGDSAGGGLTLATAVAVRDGKLPQPGALILISPWTDLSLGGESIKTHATRDPVLHASWLAWSARFYCGDRHEQHPGCSPLFADLTGLPPMLIQVGSEEILLDDSRRLEQRARAAGVSVRLHEYEGLWHDFQAHAGLLRESDAALAEMAEFLKEASLSTAKSPASAMS